MTTPEYLTKLNPQQLDAVTTTEGALLILAGAGSGKTRVLTRRIAHLVQLGANPQSILAVTFTNKAASEMKERVTELVGDVARKLWVSTFHATCCRILRHDIEALGYTQRFSIYDDDDQVRIIRRILADLNIDRKTTPPKSILSEIDYHKNRGRGPDDVVDQVRGHNRQVILRVWREYEIALRAADALDFNDLIGVTVRLFNEHPDILTKWQQRFVYLLVDEYQDTNATQYRLLRLLAEPHRHLAVVGDDDQSIYGFRGADIQNILSFQRDYPGAKVIRMEQNYRSTPNILAVSNALVAQNTGRMEKRLWADGEAGRPVHFACLSGAKEEAEWVATTVRRMHTKALAWDDIAIVYRTNATSRLFEASLRQLNVPHKVVGGRKFYERREVRDMLSYLRLIVNPADDAALLRVINVPTRGIGAKALQRLREEATQRGEPLLSVAGSMTSGTPRARKAIASFATLIETLTAQAREQSPPDVVAATIRESGYLAMLEAEETRESQGRRENLSQLISDAAEFRPEDPHATAFEGLSSWLDTISLAGQTDDTPEGGQVTLTTVHNAKGLEYPVVFVVHMMEGQFPHKRSMDTTEGIEEERRLAYVAFTRAMHTLVVTWNRRGTAFDRDGMAEPSRFLYGLPGDAVGGDVVDAEPAAAREITVRAQTKSLQQRKLQAFIQGQRHHQSTPAPHDDAPDDPHVLVELEDMSQLTPGATLHHPRHGVGVVRRLTGPPDRPQVWVDFAGPGVRPVPVFGSGLQLVVE